METGTKSEQASTSNGEPTPHVLPSGSKAHRLSAHMQGLVEDLQTWIELRVKLAQMEIEEQVDQKVNALVRAAIMGVVAALAGFFALVSLALGLGWALGHPFWGFLIVTVLLGIVVLIVREAEPRLIKIAKGYVRVDETKSTRGRSVSSNNSN